MNKEALHVDQSLIEVVCICGHLQSEHNFLGDENCNNVERIDDLWIPCLCDKFFPL